MRTCSVSLVMREMKTKTALRYYFTLTGMFRITKTDYNECYECGEIGIFLHCSKNVKWHNPFRKHFGSSSNRGPMELKVDLQYDSAVPLPDL